MSASELALVAALAAALSAVAFLACARERVKTDEGYLWYGALRTLDGEVPLRDFRSYEPGRYYWSALWMRALGPGVLALRAAQHGFYFLGLACGLAALRVSDVAWPAVIAAALLLAAWAYPNHKLFEQAMAMAAVLAGTVLLAHPGAGTILAAGALAGATSFFGLNYALYAGASLLGLTLLAAAKSGAIATSGVLAAYLAGAAAGALPLLALGALAPGLFGALHERRVRQVLERGSTNLPRPVPWPWRPGTRSRAARWFIGIYFALLPAFGWSVVLWAVLAPWGAIEREAALVASGFVGATVLHHAFSRADFRHLAQCMPPVILGSIALLGHGVGWALLGGLLGLGTLVTVIPAHPLARRLRHPSRYVQRNIAGMRVWIRRDDAKLIRALRPVVRRLERGEPLLALPTLAALFPILGRRSAVYDNFCVYPAGESQQRAMLHSISEQGVRLAVVRDRPVDGREELRFSRTHPAVWSYLVSEFVPLELCGLPDGYHVLWRPIHAETDLTHPYGG